MGNGMQLKEKARLGVPENKKILSMPFPIKSELNPPILFCANETLLSHLSPDGFVELLFGKDIVAHGGAAEASADHSIFSTL